MGDKIPRGTRLTVTPEWPMTEMDLHNRNRSPFSVFHLKGLFVLSKLDKKSWFNGVKHQISGVSRQFYQRKKSKRLSSESSQRPPVTYNACDKGHCIHIT